MDYGTSEVIAGVYLAGTPQAHHIRSLENPNLPLNDPAVWETVFGESFGSSTGINVTAEVALTYAPFMRAVRLISSDVAKLPRRVYRRRPDIGEDARERDTDHRLNYLLNTAANPETEAINFWCRFMADALVWEHAYARIMFDGTGAPAELYNLLPDRTKCEYINGQKYYITEVMDSRGPKLIPLFPWEVLTIEGLNVGGINKPLFQMARNSIALGLAQEKFAAKFFRSGGRVGGILELPLAMSKQAKDTVEEGFRKQYEGTDNPFRTVILRDNAKFHAAQTSPRDSQMVEADEKQTRAMAHVFNLPPSKLGLSDSVSYNSKSEDNQNYLDTTLQIWMTKIESACNFRLISERQAKSHFIEHNVKQLLRMNPLAQAQVHSMQIAARIINPNEARADINKLPYEGGEEYLNPNTTIGGGGSGEQGVGPGEIDRPPGGRSIPEKGTPYPWPDGTKPDAAYMRVLFGITARARDKAKRPNAFIEWIDGNFAPHRAEWQHICGDKKFPFDGLHLSFTTAANTNHAESLPGIVENICQLWEEC